MFWPVGQQESLSTWPLHRCCWHPAPADCCRRGEGRHCQSRKSRIALSAKTDWLVQGVYLSYGQQPHLPPASMTWSIQTIAVSFLDHFPSPPAAYVTQNRLNCPMALCLYATPTPVQRLPTRCWRSGRPARSISAAAQPRNATFPQGFTEAVGQAQQAVNAAVADGHNLIEVEFPSASLSSVSGDGEGGNEMTQSCQLLRQFVRQYQGTAAAGVRIFFPDQQELEVAKTGKAMNPAAGSWDLDAIFDQTSFQLDYLTRPTGLNDWGIDIHKANVTARVRDTDKLFIAAYPSFNVNEIIAVEELWKGAARDSGRPILVFNGELDRLRGSYYPALFYPKLARLSKTFIPLFTQAYYIHNFKGSRPGALFRAYPGPWQVMRRHPVYRDELVTVHTQETMPTLRQVALDILPNN